MAKMSSLATALRAQFVQVIRTDELSLAKLPTQI